MGRNHSICIHRDGVWHTISLDLFVCEFLPTACRTAGLAFVAEHSGLTERRLRYLIGSKRGLNAWRFVEFRLVIDTLGLTFGVEPLDAHNPKPGQTSGLLDSSEA